MTTYYPLSFTVPQYINPSTYQPYSGAVLKAYAEGTSTPISMATDYAGGTLVTTIVLNASGFPAVSGNVVIPHFAQNYKLMLYPTAAAAALNTGEIWSVDNIKIVQSSVASTFSDAIFVIQDDGDVTKQVQFQASGLTTATTVVLTPPTSSATLATTTLAQTFVGAQKASATALTSASASIAIDLSLNNDFTHTLTENTTLANPTNIMAGQKGRLLLTQHASSPKTLAYGGYYKFPAGSVPSLTASNGALDVLYYDVLNATNIACNLVKGFA